MLKISFSVFSYYSFMIHVNEMFSVVTVNSIVSILVFLGTDLVCTEMVFANNC
jgi:hypothetical protein